MSSIATFSGLASGVQWQDMVDQIMRAETARRLTPVQKEASLDQKRIDGLNRYKDLVAAFGTAAKSLRDATAFGKLTVSTPVSPTTGRTLVSATASDTATPGTHSVEVVSLARAHSMASSAQTSDTTALNLSGTFSLNGKTITVGTGDSLAAIRDQINGAGAGVTASVLKVADGSYRLTVTSSTMGAAGISYGDGPEGVGAALGIATTVAGADAEVNVNGVSVLRQTNSITDAITGVTLNLQQAEAGTTIQLKVERDQQAIVDAVKAFADAYNAVRAYVDQQNAGGAQPLARSSVLRTSLSTFKNVLLSEVTDPSATTYDHLVLVGVALTREGTLAVDETKLKEVIGSGLDDLRVLLTDVGARMTTATDEVTRDATGAVAVQITSLNDSIASLNRRSADIEARLELQRERITREFVLMEEALGRFQAQGSWLASQISALTPVRG